MATPSVDTACLHGWIDRMRAGDAAARDELLRGVCGQLERLAHKMLKRCPGVRRWAETGDVLQNALVRLLRALQEVRPESTRAFFALAAEQMRRELLDLARHFHGPGGLGANHASHPTPDAPEPPAPAEDADELEKWCAFHEAVAQLPAEEREVVGLIYYHDWPQADVARLCQVTVRTVQRRWASALAKLHRRLQDA